MHDLTVSLREGMPTFPGTPSFEVEQLQSHEDAGTVVHYLTMNTHHGTHIDAPAHYIPDGKTIDQLDLECFNGSATVFDLREYSGEPITERILRAQSPPQSTDDRVILLTGDVDRYFEGDFFDKAAYLTEDGAEWLIEQNVSLIANDFLTEAVPGDPHRPVHKALLGAEIPILEYICNASAIADTTQVTLQAFPLLLSGLEAAPVRAVATRP